MDKVYIITHPELGFVGAFESEKIAQNIVKQLKPAPGGFPWEIEEWTVNHYADWITEYFDYKIIKCETNSIINRTNATS